MIPCFSHFEELKIFTVVALMSSSLKEYLKKYTSEEKPKTKKKKKQQKNTENKNNGVLIVDEDPMWQAQIKEESSEEDFPDEKPQVEEDVEVKRMRRLEQLKAQRPYLAVAGDGSGWVTVSDTKKAENNDISDISVRDQHDSPDFSPPRKTLVESDDISPPRKHEREKPYSRSRDLSPSRKPSSTSPDLSPPRKREKDTVAEDSKKTRKVRHDSPDISESADLSPPRNHNKHAAFVRNKDIQTRDDASADGMTGKRKVRHDSPEISEPQDLSPPRKHNRNSTPGRSSEDFPNKSYSMRDSRISSDLSPPRKHVKDISPERRNSKRVLRRSSDLSPTRKQLSNAEKGKSESKHYDSPDLSPPRKFNSRQDSFSRGAKMDISPPRRNRSETDQDISPPRKSKNDSKFSTNGDLKGKGRCIDGSIAGLRSQKELKEEIDRKRQDETQRFQKMDPSLSGRDAGTVYRDKHGRKLEGLEEFMKLQKGPPKPEEKPLEWGKGLAQKREAEARQAELELERNKPFARSRDDPDLDNMLKERVRWGDPMAHLVKRKKEEPVLENLAEDEKLRESGFIVPQNIPEHSWLKRGVDAPPNRYGIKPGRHWDGVDRSNGFEKQQFKRQSEKKATQTEAYLWSVADM